MTLRILILEDELPVLAALMEALATLEDELAAKEPYRDIAVMVLSTYEDVEHLINHSDLKFDAILLDRDCKLGGSFHVLDFEKFGVDKVISISMVRRYNEDAEERGVTRVILKEHDKLPEFTKQVAGEVLELLEKSYGDQLP